MRRGVEWVLWSPARLVVVLLVVVAVVLGVAYALTRPGSGAAAAPSSVAAAASRTPDVPTSSTSSGAPSAASTAVPPADEPADVAVLEPVTAYLQARENRAGADRASAADWLAEARPALTPAFHDALDAEAQSAAGGSLGWEWDQYHANGWHVQVSGVSCHPHGDVYNPAGQETALVCTYLSTLVDDEGQQVPHAELPSGWVANRDALVSVTQADGWWRVSGDSTGQAG